ncbi:NTP transferase domain-containing protein [Reichenbachiella sp. MALMAid0571]|uniref:nucleotidyltransferase family protein n=1 Tax=Reichenbachiella sp. MALMAid0571 TaxID=3143939 RepID=UPI0032DEB940
MKPTLLVLAAGRGSRFGGAKQVSEMGPSGETIMEYSIHDALQSGFGKVVLVINKQVEADTIEIMSNTNIDPSLISYAYQDLFVEHISDNIQSERLKPWGTAHAILSAEKLIGTPFAMINADDFYGRDAFKTMADFLSTVAIKDSSKYSMVGYDLINTLSDNGKVSRGISVSDDNGYLTSITETHNIFADGNKILCSSDSDENVEVKEGLASMNFWGFNPNIFKEMHEQFQSFLSSTPNLTKDEFQIPSVIDKMIKDGKITVSVLHSKAKWFGVTYKEDRPVVVEKLSEFVKEGKYKSPLWK